MSCHKYKDIRKTFFQSYGLDLKDSHNTYFLLSKLLNPKNISSSLGILGLCTLKFLKKSGYCSDLLWAIITFLYCTTPYF
jgi:hypothetical protein